MTGISEALLFTRSSPKLARAAEWDVWEVDKHMYDLVRGPGVTSSTMYRRLEDARLPQALRAGPRRAVTYRAPTLAAMRLWLDSETLREAVTDGRTWIDAYDPLEDQWFTGNVYSQLRHLGDAPDPESDILAERYEVSTELIAEFETWLDAHAARVAALDGIAAVQSFRVVRDIGNELYLSPGNFALVAAIQKDEDSVACLTTDRALDVVRRSQEWELRLPYLTRELLKPGGHMFAPGDEVSD